MDEPWVALRRTGGSPPPDYELLDISRSGEFSMWRTIGRASRPSSPVGSFGGSIANDDRAELDATVTACENAGAVTMPPAVDASVETVTIGGIASQWGDDECPPAPWEGLANHLRRLLGEGSTSPRAAIALHMDQGGPSLVHLGEHDLRLDLSQAVVRAVLWDGPAAADNHEVPLTDVGRLTASKGWRWPLPFDHPWSSAATVTCHVDELGAFDGTDWRFCALDQPAAST